MIVHSYCVYIPHMVNGHSPVPKCLKKANECTNFFCWQSAGLLILMFSASRAWRWKKLRPRPIMVNIWLQKFFPHSGFLTRCSAIEDVSGSCDIFVLEPSAFSSFGGMCCLIRVLSRWFVLPTYALSQLHVNR